MALKKTPTVKGMEKRVREMDATDQAQLFLAMIAGMSPEQKAQVAAIAGMTPAAPAPAPTVATGYGFKGTVVGRRGRAEAQPRNGVQIVPATDAKGNVLIREGRKTARGRELSPTVNFITVDEAGNPSPPVEDLDNLIRECVDESGIFLRRYGWAPSQDFAGHYKLPNTASSRSGKKGQRYLPVEVFAEVFRTWNEQVPQIYIEEEA